MEGRSLLVILVIIAVAVFVFLAWVAYTPPRVT
jgi:hypothetical protein